MLSIACNVSIRQKGKLLFNYCSSEAATQTFLFGKKNYYPDSSKGELFITQIQFFFLQCGICPCHRFLCLRGKIGISSNCYVLSTDRMKKHYFVIKKSLGQKTTKIEANGGWIKSFLNHFHVFFGCFLPFFACTLHCCGQNSSVLFFFQEFRLPSLQLGKYERGTTMRKIFD